MEASPENNPTAMKALYTNYLRGRLSTLLPIPGSTNFVGKISNLYRRSTRATSRRSRVSLPLPLPSVDPCAETSETSRVFDVLEDMLEHILLNLHNIQKNLQFWQSRAEGSNARKVYFMIFERGPTAFLEGTTRLVREWTSEGSGMQSLCHSASAYISERITVLTSLRYLLASFLAQVYIEVDKFGEDLVKDPETSLSLLLVSIDGFFGKLEASIGQFHAKLQSDTSIDESSVLPLMFEKLPEVNREGSQWTDCEIRDAANSIYQNLHKLDSYLSDLVAKHQKPQKLTLYWLQYTGGAIGLSLCSLWLVRHSRLSGSPDIDNWIREAKDSFSYFWNDHVEQPVLFL